MKRVRKKILIQNEQHRETLKRNLWTPRLDGRFVEDYWWSWPGTVLEGTSPVQVNHLKFYNDHVRVDVVVQ